MDTLPTEVQDLAATLASCEGVVLFGSSSPRTGSSGVPYPVKIVLFLFVLPATLPLLEVTSSTTSLVSVKPPPVVSTIVVQITDPVLWYTGRSGTVMIFFSTEVRYCTVVKLTGEGI